MSQDEKNRGGSIIPMLRRRASPERDHAEALRILEALLFASNEPLSEKELARHLPEDAPLPKLLAQLQQNYKSRGVHLARVADKWLFRTAEDLAYLLRREETFSRPLSRPALETLAVIAYHQPITRAEIEAIRGKSFSAGTMENLFRVGWLKICGRRRAPGRPVTYGVSEDFLAHFGLESLKDLPGLDELKAAGLLEKTPPRQDAPSPEETSPADARAVEARPADARATEARPDEDSSTPA